MKIKVLALTRYGNLGASSRMRFIQYFDYLRDNNIELENLALLENNQLIHKQKTGKYRLTKIITSYIKRIILINKSKNYDLIWIEKECLPFIPFFIEKILLKNKKYILDYDDAWFHLYDQHRLNIIKKLLGKKLYSLMREADLVITGNNYLKNHAEISGSKSIEIIPTTIDLDRYQKNTARKTSHIPTIVWIGSPSTEKYLSLLENPLKLLKSTHNFKVRIIGGFLKIEGIEIECLEWDETLEVEQILECDIGVMPLFNTPWEKGKCGYKLIQYMACCLPVIASPVGINNDIVFENVNGFLAKDDLSWLSAFEKLISDPKLRLSMGAAGRDLVEAKYCKQVTQNKLLNLIKKISKD